VKRVSADGNERETRLWKKKKKTLESSRREMNE
jgi:hypothetical protein